MHVQDGELLCARAMDCGTLKHTPDGKESIVWS